MTSQINKKDQALSNNYLSHAWTNDCKLLVGTDAGEILLLDQNCDFKTLIQTSPLEGWSINVLQTYSKGFLVAGEDATIYLYERNEDQK